MKFGYCTGFSTNPHFLLGEELLPLIKDCGFDFAEFPLMNFRNMSETEFSDFAEKVESYGLCGPSACNFFPGSVRLVGREVNAEQICSYLDVVLPRCKRLGISKIILGSGPARTFGAEQTREQAFEQFAGLLQDVVLPKTKACGILVCIEPFERNYCNLIVSVTEGLELVKKVSDSGLALMIDLYHMLSNNEPIECIREVFPYIRHVHVAGANRALTSPKDKYIYDALKLLKKLGYEDTVSFETELEDAGRIKEELKNIRATFKTRLCKG